MSELPKLNPVTITKFTGDRKSAVTSTGKTVYRQDKLWMGKQYGFVAVANYGSHFIYSDPDLNQQTGEWPRGKKYVGRFSPMCSCNSPAGIVGSNVYRGSASPTSKEQSTHPGQMIVCLHVANYGIHMDGSHD